MKPVQHMTPRELIQTSIALLADTQANIAAFTSADHEEQLNEANASLWELQGLVAHLYASIHDIHAQVRAEMDGKERLVS